MKHQYRLGVAVFAKAEPEDEGVYYRENEERGGDVAKTIIETGGDEDGEHNAAVAEEVDEPAVFFVGFVTGESAVEDV